MLNLLTLMATPMPRALPAEEIPTGILITEISIAFVLLVLMFLLRKRFLKIICACGTVICLFLVCKLVFGSDSLVTDILRWITAAAACILTVSIVNRINWSNLRGKSDK
jgi:hypothetical protein